MHIGRTRFLGIAGALLWAYIGLASTGYAQSEPATEAGESLFDTLFRATDGSSVYRIPYPFDALLADLEQHLGLSINGDPNTVSTVRIPLGRCINRYAAEPDYFRYPRVIVAVDSQHYGEAYHSVRLLRDRIFLGYQEKTGTIEVISYSDETGRFEFQQVTDYLPGKQPRVEPANRERCVACHQNQGPIFSRPLWDETENNPQIEARLTAAAGTGRAPVSPARAAVARIDASCNRANLFALYQTFWQQACHARTEEASRLCQAGLLQLVLQNRLQESSGVLLSSDLVANYLLPVSRRNIKQLWPHGIPLPSSDISNRNPIWDGIEQHLAAAEQLIIPRPAPSTWQPDDLVRIIDGLGQMIALNDIRQLDRRLYNKAAQQPFGRVTMEGDCRLTRIDDARQPYQDNDLAAGEIVFRCQVSEGAVSSRYRVMGELELVNNRVQDAPFNRLVLGGPDIMLGLTHSGGHLQRHGRRFVLKLPLRDSHSRLHARLPGLGIVEHIAISWDAGPGLDNLISRGSRSTGKATISVLPEQQFLDSLLVDLARADEGELLGSRPFNGARLIQAILARL